MALRVIHIWDVEGVEHVFMFLILDESEEDRGISFELAALPDSADEVSLPV
jgi:hypothetical protein